MNTSKTSLLLALGLSLAGSRALAENTANVKTPQLTEWVLDAAHTHVGFSVPHMVVSEVEGKFDKFSGKVLLDESDPAKSQVEFTAETASIDTGVTKRDEHLVSADFFDAAKFPAITFKSVSIAKARQGLQDPGRLDDPRRHEARHAGCDAERADAESVRSTSPCGQAHRNHQPRGVRNHVEQSARQGWRLGR